MTLSTFAPYDTIHLIATPLDAFGAPVPTPLRDSAVTTFFANDPTDTNFVLDSVSGLLRARHADRGIIIRTRTVMGGITRMDSVLVNITEVRTPPVFARLVLQATPGDTLFRANPFKPIPAVTAQALDSHGNPIDSVTVSLWSSNPALFLLSVDGAIRISDYQYRPSLSQGTAFVYASATVYGVTHVDSIPMTVTLPYIVQVFVGFYTPKASLTSVGYFKNPVDSISAGGVVAWMIGNELTDSIDVTFDNPAQITALPADSPFNLFTAQCDPGGHGNIATWAIDSTKACANTIRWRYFASPGTYHYHSERYGTTGTVVVQ